MQLAGFFKVLFPANVTTKLFPRAMFILIQAASVIVTIGLYARAFVPMTKLPGVVTEAPTINLLPIRETLEEVDTLRYRISARDVSGTLVVHTPMSALAAVPRLNPFVLSEYTDVPSHITNPTAPSSISYPSPPAVFIFTISDAVVLADTLLLIT